MAAQTVDCRFPGGPKCGAASRERSVECMKAIIVGGGVGGLTTALMLHARGIDCEVYRAGRRHPRARRRHQHAAACHQGAEGARAAGAARRGRDPHLRAVLPEPLRPGDLARAARARCRLRRAAVLDPSRQAAERDLPGGARAARREPHPHRPPARQLQAGRRRRHRVFLRPRRLAPRDRAGRHSDRRRRHPFGGARQPVSRTKARRAGTAPCCGAARSTGRNS